MGLLTICLNGGFLFVAFKSDRLKTCHNILLIFLSATDLFTGVIVFSIKVVRIFLLLRQTITCTIIYCWELSLYILTIISFCHLALISLEKYLAIIHPYYYQRKITKQRLIKTSLIVWFLAILFPVSSFLSRSSFPMYYHWFWALIVYLFLIVYVAMIYIYVRIFVEIKRVQRRVIFKNSSRNQDQSMSQSSKAAKTTAIIIGCFTLCYLPLMIRDIFRKPIEDINISSQSHYLLWFITQLILQANSLVNPVVYYIRMVAFRREIRHACFGEARQNAGQ